MKKFKITIGDKNYEITAERDSATPSLLNLTVDGNAHSIQIEEEEAPKSTPGPRRAAAPSKPSGGGGGEGSIVAQIPGTVLDVEVSVGDSVNEGDRLIVLEAMKMENILRAERDGVVAALSAAPGDSLAVDDVILEFE